MINNPPNIDRIFYVDAYGATANSGVDSRLAIQSAIDACYAAGGGVVQLGAGEYRVQDTGGIALLLKTGVWLRGMGAATVVKTDNTLATANYVLIAPFGYNTVTVPYTAHEMQISDMVLTGTSASAASPDNRLHDLIACINGPKSRIMRVGFDTTAAHYVEWGHSLDNVMEDCYATGAALHGTAKFQCDGNAFAGQQSNPRWTATITNAATYASAQQTLLTVNSTSNLKEGQAVVITGANGASASTYNAVGGYRIVRVVDGTTVSINLPWTGNATTAGTLTVLPVLDGVTINRFIDKSNTDTTTSLAREFLDLSHNSAVGIYRNISVTNCVLRPKTYTVEPGGNRLFMGFDNAAYPLEYTGLTIADNTFIGGGNSGTLQVINIAAPYSATYATRISGVRITGNRCINVGMESFLYAGNVGFQDGRVQTSLTMVGGVPSFIRPVGDVYVADNYVEVAFRGNATSVARPTRVFNFGGMDTLVCARNKVVVPNKAPDNLIAAWSSGSLNGFQIDHVRYCTMDSNRVESYLDSGCLNGSPVFAPGINGFSFGCSCFELAATLTPGSQRWTNNSVFGYSTGGGVAHVIRRGFTEVMTPGTTGMSSWASTTNPQVKGVWSGNSVSSTPGVTADTCGGYLTLNVPNGTSPGAGAVAAAACEAPDGSTNCGRHRWGYGPRTGAVVLSSGVGVVTDNMVTANSIITVNRSTDGGTIGASYSVTRSVGVSFTITAKDSAGATQAADTSTLSYVITEPN